MDDPGAPHDPHDDSGDDRLADESTEQRAERKSDLKSAIVGGLIAAVVGFGTMATVGTASDVEARRLLEGVLPTVRFAASAYVAGGATMLALMLTLITFSITHEDNFTTVHYRRIRDLALLTAATIVGSVVILMAIAFPLDEVDVSRGWYLPAYYFVLFAGAAAGGAFITVIMMLYYAVGDLLDIVREDRSARILAGDR